VFISALVAVGRGPARDVPCNHREDQAGPSVCLPLIAPDEAVGVVLDVDHFKRFNDTYGHAGGDAMLREVGSVLNHSLRESDIVCGFDRASVQT
jgi:hypothetical protein